MIFIGNLLIEYILPKQCLKLNTRNTFENGKSHFHRLNFIHINWVKLTDGIQWTAFVRFSEWNFPLLTANRTIWIRMSPICNRSSQDSLYSSILVQPMDHVPSFPIWICERKIEQIINYSKCWMEMAKENLLRWIFWYFVVTCSDRIVGYINWNDISGLKFFSR